MKLSTKALHKFSRILHKDLSFFFAGMVLIYAISGLVMNHRGAINPYYDVKLISFTIKNIDSLKKEKATEASVKNVLKDLGETDNYTHSYFQEDQLLKIFLKGGSNVVINTNNGEAQYEKVNKKILIGSMAKLHYNPQKWWTYFSDAFAIGLIIIVITGFTMMKSKQLIWSRAFIEVILGIIIPLCFIFFFI